MQPVKKSLIVFHREYASFRRAEFGHDWTDLHAREWSSSTDVISRWSADPRFHVLRYEHLITSTEQALREICDFLGEDYAPAMLANRAQNEYRLAPHEGWRLEHERRALAPVSLDSLERWREELSPYKIAVIEHTCGRAMDRLGYARKTRGLSVLQIARLHLGRLRRNARYLYQRTAGRIANPMNRSTSQSHKTNVLQ